MGITETLIFYSLAGVGVALSVLLGDDSKSLARRVSLAAGAFFFWPLYLPILLQRPPERLTGPDNRPAATNVSDEMSTVIAQVERELDIALCSLDGWAEDVLSRESDRFAELRSAWNAQAGRIRELDRLLAQPAFVEPAEHGNASPFLAAGNPTIESERILHSEQTRRENVERLKQLRRQMHQDFMGTLAWVRELVTMIHLAKYTGAPASRAEELITQIAAAVEGLSEVTNWHGQFAPTAADNT